MDDITTTLLKTLTVVTRQVALATGVMRVNCPMCGEFGPWEIPQNLIGVICGSCGAWCLVREP